MKNKIFTISIIFILLSLIFINNNIFAYSMDDAPWTPDETTLNFIYNRDEYKSGKYNYVFYQVYGSNKNYMVFFSKDLDIIPVVEWSEENSCYQLSIGSAENTFDFIRVENDYYVTEYTDNFISPVLIGQYFHADVNVSNKTTGTYFFQSAPVTLAEALEVANPIQQWKLQMKSVVVSLVVFLVGLIAFFKAWAWLKIQLSKA